MLTQGYDPQRPGNPPLRQKREDQMFKATHRDLQFEACLEVEEEREGRRGGYLGCTRICNRKINFTSHLRDINSEEGT